MSLWDSILELIGGIVSPDWGGLVLLIPLAVVLVVAAYLAWVIRRFATAGPETIRPLPAAPAPSGIHLPGPSLAPFLIAGGALLFFAMLVFVRIESEKDPDTGAAIPDSATIVVEPLGIVAVVLGILALVGALLYWGREATREYDALEAPPALVPVAHTGPPAGVHVPGPSFRPLLASIAAATLLLGLVVHPALLVAGVLMTVIGLLGWLNDARKEYRAVVRADATGHLENIPAPGFPIGTLAIFVILLVGALLVAGGIFPPREGTSGGGGGAPTAAPASPASGGGDGG